MRILVVEDEFGRAGPPAALEAESSRPASRLLVCVGPRCVAEGRGRALLAALREELATSPDAAVRVEVTTRDCLRACTRDPIVRLKPSGDLFSDPTVEDLLRAAGATVLRIEPD